MTTSDIQARATSWSDSAFVSATDDDFRPSHLIDAYGQSSIEIDAEALLRGDYARAGSDLLIQAPDGSTTLITGYFAGAESVPLVSPGGAMLLPHAVELLAGPAIGAQYAQAGGATAQNPIGQIELLSGGATVQHADGTTETLSVGSSVFEDDVVSTDGGSKMSIKFIDGTALSMSANARMIMDELVYDPNATDNSMVLNLVQGSFVFVTGAVAKTGTVSAETPVATMGIRGTTPAVTIDADQTTTFGIRPDPDGTVGVYEIVNLQTGQVLGSVSSPEFVYRLASATGQLEQLLATAAQLGDVDLLLQDTYNTFGTPGGNNDDGNNQDDGQQDDGGQQDGGQQGGQLDDPSFNNFVTQFTQLTIIDRLLEGEFNPGAPPPPPFTQQALNDFLLNGPPPPPINNPGTTTPIAFSFSGGGLTVGEDSSGNGLSGFNISYPNDMTVTLTAGSTVTLNSTAGLTFITGDGTDDHAMTFTGSAAAITAALNGATYTPTPDSNTGSLQIVFVDATTQQIVGSINVPITITPDPDPPVANNDLFFDIPEDAGRDGNDAFTANLFEDNGAGVDGDPDPGEDPVVTQFWVDTDHNGTYETNIVLSEGVGTYSDGNGGSITIHSNGDIEITPGTYYESLSENVSSDNVGTEGAEAPFSFNLQYQIESGGETAIATVTGVVTGDNDAPEGVDGEIEANNYTEVTGKLEAGDVDSSDKLTFSLVTGPENGSVVINSDGSFTFTPSNTFTGADSFVYQVSDGNGGVDQVTYDITTHDYNIATDTQTFVADNGQEVTMTLVTEAQTDDDYTFANLNINLTDPDVTHINVSFAFDASGSMGSGPGSNYELQMQAIQSAIDDLRIQYANSSAQVDVQMVQYGSTATSQVFDLFDSGLDDVLTDFPTTGGGTDFELALQQIENFLTQESQSGDTNYVIFTSDGDGSGDLTDELEAIQPIASISAFGIGGSANLGTLDIIDNTGEGADQVLLAGDLAAAFSATPVFGLDLISFQLTLDNGGDEPILFADQDDLVQNGLNYSLSIDAIRELANFFGEGQPDENTLTASVTFDTDGNPENQTGENTFTVSTTITAGNDAQLEIDGTGGTDFLVGGHQADFIDGLGGNDLILGLGGDDYLNGGDGDDILIGGLGADTLTGGAGNDVFVIDYFPDSWSEEAADSITDFNINDDSLDISKLLTAAFDTENAGQFIMIDSYSEGSSTHADVYVDADGPGEGADYELVASIEIEGSPETVVMNIVYNDAGDSVQVEASPPV